VLVWTGSGGKCVESREGIYWIHFFFFNVSLVSMRYIIAVMCAGSFVIRHVSGSRMEESLVGVLSFYCLSRDNEVLKMDLRASLGFFMNMDSRADLYLRQRALLASFLLSLVVTFCSL